MGSLLLLLLSSQSLKQAEYLNLAAVTLANPITSAELSRAVLSAEGVEAIRMLFVFLRESQR